MARLSEGRIPYVADASLSIRLFARTASIREKPLREGEGRLVGALLGGRPVPLSDEQCSLGNLRCASNAAFDVYTYICICICRLRSKAGFAPLIARTD